MFSRFTHFWPGSGFQCFFLSGITLDQDGDLQLFSEISFILCISIVSLRFLSRKERKISLFHRYFSVSHPQTLRYTDLCVLRWDTFFCLFSVTLMLYGHVQQLCRKSHRRRQSLPVWQLRFPERRWDRFNFASTAMASSHPVHRWSVW